ncbi:uncharacterized protein LOC121404539 [Drosophila obscura]|uniref:uncharacterized protein LOC121404539 n=1 Tax=Drosophila obscura TaxID=7282 RepID=UPI001BB170C7|nr:uncharacterized protein LOC121404539 [Drosophila obscura]
MYTRAMSKLRAANDQREDTAEMETVEKESIHKEASNTEEDGAVASKESQSGIVNAMLEMWRQMQEGQQANAMQMQQFQMEILRMNQIQMEKTNILLQSLGISGGTTGGPGPPSTTAESSVTTDADLPPRQPVAAQETHRNLYDLSEFNGAPEEWPMFNEAFIVTTAEYGYRDRQNLIRLQKAIKGKARETVECLLIHSSNVPNILETLKQHFGRPEKLVKSQISRVREFPSIREGRLEQLVDFKMKVQNLASFLEAASAHQQLKNPTLMEELILKLPVQQRLEWARHSKPLGDEKSIHHLSLWLQGLAEDVQEAGLVDDQVTFKPRKEKSRLFHANEMGPEKEKACSACQGKHDLDNCKVFAQMELQKKWLHVREGKLCFNCLKYGHRSQKCRRQNQCQLDGCLKRIHWLLHEESVKNPDEEIKFTGTATHEENSIILFKILPPRGPRRTLADELGLHGPRTPWRKGARW